MLDYGRFKNKDGYVENIKFYPLWTGIYTPKKMVVGVSCVNA